MRCIVAACLIAWLPIAAFDRSNAEDTVADVPPHVTHGPVLGRLEADSVGVWARTSEPTSFYVRYGTAEDSLNQRSATIPTDLDRDNTAWVELPGIEPGKRYYYRVVVAESDGIATDVSRFRSLPAPRQMAGPLNPQGLFNFAFSATSCAKQSPTQSQGAVPHATMLENAADNVDFHVVLGDWLYEQDRRYPTERWLAAAGSPDAALPELVRYVPTLAGAWQNYKTYFDNDRSLRLWHATVPSLFLFDDHEVLNNFQDATVVGHAARNALFRDPGLRAWRDYLGWANPGPDPAEIRFGRTRLEAGKPLLHDPEANFTDLTPDEETTLHVHWGGPDAGYRDTNANNRSQISAAIEAAGPVDPNAAVYRIERIVDDHTLEIEPEPTHDSESSYSIGGLRYYFSQRLANADIIGLDTRSRRRSPLVSVDPTMLGEAQKRWLMQQLRASDADLVFLLSSVSFVVPHVSSSPQGEDDQSWSGYPKERNEVLTALEDTGKTVIIMSGDLHNAYAIRISDRIWEFSAGPIGSLNRAMLAPGTGGVPVNGPYESAGLDTTIRWATRYLVDTPVQRRRTPVYAIVRVNNVFDSQGPQGRSRWIAYRDPQVVVQFYQANTGQLLYAESVLVEPR